MRPWIATNNKKNRPVGGRVKKKDDGLFCDSVGHELLQ